MKISHSVSRSGNVLALTLLLAAAMAATGAAYMSSTTSAFKVTQSNQNYHNLLPVAERGIDEAMHTLYRYTLANKSGDVWSSTPDLGMWTRGGWTRVDDKTYAKNFWSQSLNIWGAQRYANLKVVVRNVPSAANPALMPNVVAQTTFLGSDSTDWGADKTGPKSYSRQFAVWLKTRSAYANSMVGIKSVTVSGGVFSADSYKSAYGSYTGVYSSANPGDKATIATLSTLDDAISTGSITVRGYVVTGGDNPIDDIAGSHVFGYSTDPSYAYTTTGIDPTRVARDFSAKLPTIKAPTGATTAFPAGTKSGGTTTYTLTSGTYRLSSGLSLNGSDIIKVTGDVVIIADGGADVSLSGSSSITLTSTASTLRVYTPANFDITGNGIVNPSGSTKPSAVTVYGTNTTAGGQLIKMAGNAAYSGTIYAPNANVQIKGGGSSGAFFGSVIGYTIVATGGTNFHYDESLTAIADPSYYLASWLELTGSSRVKMSDYKL